MTPQPQLKPLVTELRQIIAEVGDIGNDFPERAHLYEELGLPSVKALRLLVILEERYQVPIPEEEFVEAISLERLTSMMEKLLARA